MKKRTALLLSLSAAAAFLLFLLFSLLSFSPAGYSVRPDRSQAVSDVRLDLNRASAGELQQLPGIGPVLSEAIVSWREENGPFPSAESLLDVPGIGEKTLEGLRAYIVLSGEADEDPAGG